MSVPAQICSAVYVIIGVLVLAMAAGHRLGVVAAGNNVAATPGS
jgi:hypothetical protein